jgi:hypothetical protein
MGSKIMKKKKLEQLFGVPPESIPTCKDYFIVHKSSKNGQTSFRITKSLLDSLIKTSIQIQKQPKLILTVANDYILTCELTKNKAR